MILAKNDDLFPVKKNHLMTLNYINQKPYKTTGLGSIIETETDNVYMVLSVTE